MIEFDPDKNAKNLDKHGIDLSCAKDFDFKTAIIAPDDRKDYGESRFIAVGFLYSRLCVLVYTKRTPLIRIISLRKANKRESRYYDHYHR